MSPLDRRRRRRLSRHLVRIALFALAALIVVLVLVGGASKTGPGSAPYRRSVDRSYAALVQVLALQSAQTGHQLAALMSSMPGTTRRSLQATLDALARQAAANARAAATAAVPAPADGVGTAVAQAFSDRAQAIDDVRSAVEGLLGMGPSTTTAASTTAALSATTAASRLAAAGTLLERADRMYANARATLRHAPGAAVLARSAWLTGAATWGSAGTGAVVAAVEASTRLAPVERLVLDTNALSLTPAPVPAATASPPVGASTIPPTHRLGVTVVVADKGNVAVGKVAVSAQLSPAAGGAAARRTATVRLTPGGSIAVHLGGLPVVPGASYTLTVSVDPPSTEAPGAVTSGTYSVAVAPPAPPSVAAVAPTRGPPAGGTKVVVSGTGFTTATGVSFGTVPVHFTIVSKNELVAVAPPGTKAVAVTVTNPGGASAPTSADRFTYRQAPAPRS